MRVRGGRVLVGRSGLKVPHPVDRGVALLDQSARGLESLPNHPRVEESLGFGGDQLDRSLVAFVVVDLVHGSAYSSGPFWNCTIRAYGHTGGAGEIPCPR